MSSASLELLSDSFGSIKFAVVAAPGLCGPEERLEDLTSFYRELSLVGIRDVFVLGPVFDIHGTVSRGQRLRYLTDHYPREPEITTHQLRYRGVNVEPVMRAAGRDDWVDLPAPVVQLRRRDFTSTIPLILGFDPTVTDDDPMSHHQLPEPYASCPALVGILGGRRRHDCAWQGDHLMVSPGLFSGVEHHDAPVGGTVLDLKINNPGLTLDQSGHPCDFWDWNGTDLRRLAGC